MEMTSQEHLERKGQSYKLLLWFAMISMVMMFAGLTSAYVVSSSRKDWLKDFEFCDLKTADESINWSEVNMLTLNAKQL